MLLESDLPDLFNSVCHVFGADEISRAIDPSGAGEFTQYADDPVGFGENVLGETYTEDVKKMMESVRDNVITIAMSSNATGKTHGAARVGIWFYKSFKQAQVWTAAAPPLSNLTNLLWGEINDIALIKHPELFENDEVHNLSIQRAPLDFIKGATIPSSGTPAEKVAKFSGKHRPHLLFIIDEGDAVPDEVYEGIETCMSGGTMVRLLIMFNPRAMSGEVYRMARDGRAKIVTMEAFNHPNVRSGENIIPGAVTRNTTVLRINRYSRPLQEGETPNSECFEVPGFLVGATCVDEKRVELPPLPAGHRKITSPIFYYMVLAKYPAQGVNQLVSIEWINKARARWDVYVAQNGERPPAGVSPIQGCDVAEMGDDYNVSCMRYGGFLAKMKIWDGVDLTVSEAKFAADYRESGARQANVDATGLGAGVAPHMVKDYGCNAHGIKVANSPTRACDQGEFKLLLDQLLWDVREHLRTDPGAMLPPDEELLEELRILTYEHKNGKIVVMRKDERKELLKRSSNKLDAYAMTFAEPDTVFTAIDLNKVAV
jgi:hypothetical protein